MSKNLQERKEQLLLSMFDLGLLPHLTGIYEPGAECAHVTEEGKLCEFALTYRNQKTGQLKQCHKYCAQHHTATRWIGKLLRTLARISGAVLECPETKETYQVDVQEVSVLAEGDVGEVEEELDSLTPARQLQALADQIAPILAAGGALSLSLKGRTDPELYEAAEQCQLRLKHFTDNMDQPVGGRVPIVRKPSLWGVEVEVEVDQDDPFEPPEVSAEVVLSVEDISFASGD